MSEPRIKTITRAVMEIPLDGIDIGDYETVRLGCLNLVTKYRAKSKPILGWTETTADVYKDMLPIPWRDVLELAAADPDGEVPRSDVYDLIKRDRTQSLKGFTKPYKRVWIKMMDDGRIPGDAVMPMATMYDEDDRWVKQATGFQMPKELTPLFRF